MSDAWDEIQAIKSKRNSLRERLEKRKKERQDILGSSSGNSTVLPTPSPSVTSASKTDTETKTQPNEIFTTIDNESDPEIERLLLQILSDSALSLPINSIQLIEKLSSSRFKPVSMNTLSYFLQKFATQSYISIKKTFILNKCGYEVYLVDHSRIQSLYGELHEDADANELMEGCLKREFDGEDSSNSKSLRNNIYNIDRKMTGCKELTIATVDNDIMSLLSMPSTREKQNKQVGEEILELLSKPTAKERSLVEMFKSEGGAQVMEFCPHGTRTECERQQSSPENNNTENDSEEGNLELDHEKKTSAKKYVIGTPQSPLNSHEGPNLITTGNNNTISDHRCNKLHFKKIIQSHTDETLGDCSFLNTCFHMDTCKYVHYEVDSQTGSCNSSISKSDESDKSDRSLVSMQKRTVDPNTALHPAQWIQCDLRFLDMTVLGKFAVIMADPPWDIHMELPYGTMSDDEMRQLGVPALQDDGLIFLWVTGRAMELGRECLKLWGYERFDELIWVKTNQLQRIIRTGRTGHWLNHGKEHCLVGTKGNPKNLNRGLDCDVIVAEVRATSHKPDEIYGIIERLSPGTRKIELFGRPHNVQPNWITLGNQLDGIRLQDPDLINRFKLKYPDGNCMAPTQKPTTN
ncbi:N6-adenosine-methyltransferase MT-A70-like protein isoform X2 [Sitodiplosis mosellana]|uniref:N6-adenosine-methyltransferase MT-A70-like protein isoform X2 n=1 Tax=Sitodiplosis mosellana TaxID=263140 RepID=UPI002443C869|nr:N6-adenosine-methyltransferase MT-A70-like protein isoform X2 [Sitodiplosis mosellana]